MLLRIAFAAPLIFAPVAVVATYFGLGIVVLLSRMLAPRPKRKAAVQAVETVEQRQPVVAQAPAMLAETDADQFALPMAA